MANFFNVTLDTTGPSNPSISIQGGAQYATNQIVTLTISTSDGVTTGYQMLLWGDVDPAYNANIAVLQAGSSWMTYATSQQVKLSVGDGTKTVYCLIRDDVYNQSAQVSDSIILDTTIPTVTISGPDVTKISKVSGKDVVSFSFQADTGFSQYTVKVVPSSGSTYDTGVLIPVTAGSTNMSGSAGNYAANTPINCSVKGTDLQTASSGDGAKVVKVFVQDAAGNWSV